MNTHGAADGRQADVSLETFKEYLVESVEEDKIILGPASRVSSRPIVTVWNQGQARGDAGLLRDVHLVRRLLQWRERDRGSPLRTAADVDDKKRTSRELGRTRTVLLVPQATGDRERAAG